MKARVEKAFRDREAGLMRHRGDELELTDERFAEIDSKLPGYVVPVDGDAAQDADTADSPAAVDASSTKAELRAYLESIGVDAPARATKAQLQELAGVA